MSISSAGTYDESQLHGWLTQQIMTLSVDALKQRMVVCTACGQVKGNYIIDFQSKRYSFSTEKTYAFLCYILAEDAAN